jgi:four helix bundle protein
VKSDGNGIRERSYGFALRIVNLGKTLPKSRVGDVLGRQIIRSGTSIGANVEEATGAFSKEDFTFKMNTALKEARETHYWLRLTRDSNLVAPNRMESIIQEAEEITRILGAIVRSSRAKK